VEVSAALDRALADAATHRLGQVGRGRPAHVAAPRALARIEPDDAVAWDEAYLAAAETLDPNALDPLDSRHGND
jgi:hypothetical protein